MQIRKVLRGATVITSVAIIALVIPAVASAHRLATRAEKSATIYNASGRYYGGTRVNEPRSAPLRCFIADIATVVKGSQWGAWTFSSWAYQPAHEQQCRAGNGYGVEHKIGGRWYVLWEGDEGYPPTHPLSEGTFTLQPVPRGIARDLKAGLV